jgi:hypothetical protein
MIVRGVVILVPHLLFAVGRRTYLSDSLVVVHLLGENGCPGSTVCDTILADERREDDERTRTRKDLRPQGTRGELLS